MKLGRTAYFDINQASSMIHWRGVSPVLLRQSPRDRSRTVSLCFANDPRTEVCRDGGNSVPELSTASASKVSVRPDLPGRTWVGRATGRRMPSHGVAIHQGQGLPTFALTVGACRDSSHVPPKASEKRPILAVRPRQRSVHRIRSATTQRPRNPVAKSTNCAPYGRSGIEHALGMRACAIALTTRCIQGFRSENLLSKGNYPGLIGPSVCM